MASSNPPPPSSPESDSELDTLRRAIADLAIRVAALERGSAPVVPPVSAIARESTESRFGLTAVNRIGAVAF